MYVWGPRNNRNKVKDGFQEEENENRLASKKEGNITGSENSMNARYKNEIKRLYEGWVKQICLNIVKFC